MVDGFDAQELADWWASVTHFDVLHMLPKLVEYGGAGSAQDLVDIGTAIGQFRNGSVPSTEEATELGIAFYLIGKIARWKAAILEGQRPSDDTLKDIAIYAMMARRNRIAGGWPIGPRGESTE